MLLAFNWLNSKGECLAMGVWYTVKYHLHMYVCVCQVGCSMLNIYPCTIWYRVSNASTTVAQWTCWSLAPSTILSESGTCMYQPSQWLVSWASKLPSWVWLLLLKCMSSSALHATWCVHFCCPSVTSYCCYCCRCVSMLLPVL